MSFFQSATTIVLTFGVFLQNLIYPTPVVNERLTTDIFADPGPAKAQELGNPEDYLLPDMELFPPKQLYIEEKGGVKTIRFNTTFANVGEGPLEMIGENDANRQVTVATQRIKKTDGTTEERVIGEFVYHPTHRHWHVDRYAQFQLYVYDPLKGPTNLVAQTDKFSFCIWDEHTYDLSLPNAPKTRQYPRCPQNIQGNSVGWGDTYTASTDGQEIDITGVPDGKYTIRSLVNAENSIYESNYLNNFAILNIEIIGNTVRIFEE